MILSSQSIRDMCKTRSTKDLIHPFRERSVKHGFSYGLSSAGYDITIAQEITIYPQTLMFLILNALAYPFMACGLLKRAPFPSTMLISAVEHFNIPDNMIFNVADKSTWARLFLTVQNTIAEPGWRGFLTLELTNHSQRPIHIRRETPIAQVIFYMLDKPTDQPYKGKYQDQANQPVAAKSEN